jgi:hypothetical protein
MSDELVPGDIVSIGKLLQFVVFNLFLQSTSLRW